MLTFKGHLCSNNKLLSLSIENLPKTNTIILFNIQFNNDSIWPKELTNFVSLWSREFLYQESTVAGSGNGVRN